MLAIIFWLLLCIALTVRCKAAPIDALAVAIEEDGRIAGDDIPAEENENELIEQALIVSSQVIKDCKITYYCAEKFPHICNAGAPYLCANGEPPCPGITCAADDIPLGATVMIMNEDGTVEQYLRCMDRFGGKQKNHIDVVVATHEEALKMGVRTAEVRWVVEGACSEGCQ